MKRPDFDLDPELEAFLAPRKIQRQVPGDLRARVLARALATLAGEEIASAPHPEPFFPSTHLPQEFASFEQMPPRHCPSDTQ